MKTEDSFDPDTDNKKAQRIAYLISGYIRKSLSYTEHQELDAWVSENMKNQQLFEELSDPGNIEKWDGWRNRLDTEAALERVQDKIGITKRPAGNSQAKRFLAYWLAAAGLLIGTLLTVINRSQKIGLSKKSREFAKVQDLPPGGKHATLQLSDGSNILLDTVKFGQISTTGSSLIKDSSGIAYLPIENNSSSNRINKIFTPAGGEYQVLLSDGTRVWLNALSSLRYPEQFSDSIRRVDLTGEAYFEVSKVPGHPFVVQSGSNQVLVLGTHFDVNAYGGKAGSIVTLEEGSVKLNQSVLLVPGQQAVINDRGSIRTGPADLETVLAWKKGQFLFKMTSVGEVMQQVANWYDAKIVYKDNISEHFNASVPRDVPVSKLLHLLETTGRVHFKIEDKTITVMN